MTGWPAPNHRTVFVTRVNGDLCKLHVGRLGDFLRHPQVPRFEGDWAWFKAEKVRLVGWVFHRQLPLKEVRPANSDEQHYLAASLKLARGEVLDGPVIPAANIWPTRGTGPNGFDWLQPKPDAD